MGSSHFGDISLGSGSRSRKGKKNGDKPKQPQRGLGVAQLEKIRLHSQIASTSNFHNPPFNKEDGRILEMGFSSSPSSTYVTTPSSSSIFPLHPSNTMMGFGEVDRRTDIRFNDFQSNCVQSTVPNQWGQQIVTMPLFEENIEAVSQKKRRQERRHSMESMCHNSDSSDSQEVDLDLKLSL